MFVEIYNVASKAWYEYVCFCLKCLFVCSIFWAYIFRFVCHAKVLQTNKLHVTQFLFVRIVSHDCGFQNR